MDKFVIRGGRPLTGSIPASGSKNSALPALAAALLTAEPLTLHRIPKVRDILIRREGRTWVLQSIYEDSTPLFGPISLLIKFDKTVEIQ